MTKLGTSAIALALLSSTALAQVAPGTGGGGGGGGGTSSSFSSAFPSTGTAVGAKYVSSPPTLTNGQMNPLFTDVNGNLLVDVAAGGITGFPTGGAFSGSNNISVAGQYGTTVYPLPLLAGGTALVTSDVNFSTIGGTTAGSKGPLVQGAVTANSPSYTTGQNNPISLDLAGNVRTNGIAAYSAETTGAWTSATSLNTAITQTVQGYSVAFVSLNQGTTITGGVVTFELSDTVAFTNAYPVACVSTTNGAPSSTYTLVASTNIAFNCPLAGAAAFRVRLSTVIAGTATVNVGVQASAAGQDATVATTDNLVQIAGSNVATVASGIQKVGIADGSGTALTSAARGAQQALSTQIVDASGNQITSFSGSGNPGFTPNGNYATLAVGSTTANVALPAGSAITVYNVGTGIAYINLGTSSGVTATTSNMQIGPLSKASFIVGSNTYIAAIENQVATTLVIAGGTGVGSDTTGTPSSYGVVSAKVSGSADTNTSWPMTPRSGNIGTAHTYTAGLAIGGLQTLTSFYNHTASGTQFYGGILNGIQINLKGANQAAQFIVYVWEKNPTSSTCTDNTAFVSNSADWPYQVGPFSVTTAVPAVGTTMTSGFTPINMQLLNADSSQGFNLYYCVVANGSITLAAGDLNLIPRLNSQ